MFDAVVIGAGAAGMMCAARIGQNGKRVVLIDHADKVGEKIRISGGGRCNFTNREVGVNNFLSSNSSFPRHILKGYSPNEFVGLMKSHGLSYTEKHKGQLFCDQKSQAIIDMLVAECKSANVKWKQPCSVQSVEHDAGMYKLSTSQGEIRAKALVVATGGLPVPKIGATDFGLKLAKQFGHKLVETSPALVPLTFSQEDWAGYANLSGVAVPGRVKGSVHEAPWFDEDILFTHRGLSGPGVLQASSYWRAGQPLVLNLSGWANEQAFAEQLQMATVGAKAQVSNWLVEQLPHWPKRLVELALSQPHLSPIQSNKAAELGRKTIQPIARAIANWSIVPTGTAGYAKAEVMRGGVCTSALNAKSLESTLVNRLYFIGEVVDVTGWLGGYNFQWAWASAVAAARSITQ